ncbi:unnamed protein product, partial [Timema podura]|nr:unnamed protein product [Timema podura]
MFKQGRSNLVVGEFILNACSLYKIVNRETLQLYPKKEQLSIEIPRLFQATYTVRCMEEYSSWRENIEPHRVGLMTIAASCNMQEMLKEVLVNNLMAAGYTHKRLADEYSMYGDRKFKHHLEQSILRMKSTHESYLTNTKVMSASDQLVWTSTTFCCCCPLAGEEISPNKTASASKIVRSRLAPKNLVESSNSLMRR